MVGVSLLALILLVMAGLYLAVNVLVSDHRLVMPQTEWQIGESRPGVQPNQAFDYQEQLRKQNERLNSYDWQNNEQTVARVPIERAMEMLVSERGIGFQPVREQGSSQDKSLCYDRMESRQ